MTPQPGAVLRAVADLLEADPDKWCQRVEARLADGHDCEGTDPSAAKRCIASWIHYAAGSTGQLGSPERLVALEAMTTMEDVLGLPDGFSNIVAWNDVDGRRIEEVVAAARAGAERLPA